MNVARAGALIVIAGVVGACSGDDEAAPSTTAAAAAPTAPATSTAPTTGAVAAAPATTIPVTAAAPPSSSAASVASTPTTAPTPTAPAATPPADVGQVKQDVIDAVIASLAVYLDAARNPTDGAKLGLLPEVMTGQTLELAADLIAELVASGSIVVENPDTPAAITTFYEETFVYDAAAGTASIEFCRIGSDLRIKPGGNPDGSDQILINEVNAYRERSEFVFVEGRWLDASGVSLEKFEGSTECAPD